MRKVVASVRLAQYGPFLILALWAVLTHPAWFLDLRPLTWGDWEFLRPETMQSWLTFPQAWNRGSGIGALDYLNLAYYPQLLALGTLSHFGVPYAIAERLLYMWPAALLPLYGAYRLARSMEASRLGSLLAALVYGTNTYILIIQWQQETIAMAYGLAPWVAYCYVRALRSRTVTDLASTALLLSLCFVFDPRVATITSALIVAGTIAYAAETLRPSSRTSGVLMGALRTETPGSSGDGRGSKGRSARKMPPASLGLGLIVQTLIPLAVLAGLSLLLCAYWIIPLAASRGSGLPGLLTGQPFGNYLNLNYAFSLDHPFWTGGYPSFFHDQPPPVLFLVFPVFAFGALLVRRSRITVASALFALGGLFLAKQSAPPFPGVYSWLFFNVPGFNLYREGSKFFLAVALAYVPLIALCITDVAPRRPGLPRSRKAVAFVLAGSLAAAAILAAVPASTGALGGTFAPVTLPAEYDRVSQVLLADAGSNGFYRTFWWPAFERFGAHTSQVPAISGADAVQSYLRPYLQDPKDFRSFFNDSATQAFLDLASVRYFVVPYDPLQEIYPVYGPQSFYVGQLANQSWLQRLPLPGMTTAIFNNSQARPYVYGSSVSVARLRTYVPTQVLLSTVNVSYALREEGATFEVSSAAAMASVMLSERYDPNWELACSSGYRAAAQSILGLNAFDLPNGLGAQSCSIQLGVQTVTDLAFAISTIGFGCAVGGVVVGTVVRRRRLGRARRGALAKVVATYEESQGKQGRGRNS